MKNLVWNDEWDAYICALEPNGITQYVGETNGKLAMINEFFVFVINKITFISKF